MICTPFLTHASIVAKKPFLQNLGFFLLGFYALQENITWTQLQIFYNYSHSLSRKNQCSRPVLPKEKHGFVRNIKDLIFHS